MIRFIDFILAFLTMTLLSPLLLLLLLFGKYLMGSPIFTQARVGLHGQTFKLYKFRSLPVATDEVPTHLLDTSKIPPYGQFLRKTKLDELPQLLCVLKGDMSLVGPRPGLTAQKELFKARLDRGVLTVRPGITGLGQVCKVDMSTPVKLARVDALMIQRLKLCFYIYILFLTLLGKGLGDRVLENNK